MKATRLAARPLALGWALLIAGPLSATTALVPPLVGFSLFALGGLIAALSGIVGAVFVGRAGGPWAAVLAGGALALLPLLGPALGARSAPPINDITTDTVDVPALDPGRALGGVGLEMSWTPAFAPIIAEAYPDLETLTLPAPPSAVGASARACLERQGGQHILGEPPRIQATFTSSVFRFRDDMVVRLRPSDGGTRVDLRSRSRDGEGDLGVNAARIRAVQGCLRGD